MRFDCFRGWLKRRSKVCDILEKLLVLVFGMVPKLLSV